MCSVRRWSRICGLHSGILHNDIKPFKRRRANFRSASFTPRVGVMTPSVVHSPSTAVFNPRPRHLGLREEGEPLRSSLWSPVSPSSEPRSASGPPPLALDWRTADMRENIKLSLNVCNRPRFSHRLPPTSVSSEGPVCKIWLGL